MDPAPLRANDAVATDTIMRFIAFFPEFFGFSRLDDRQKMHLNGPADKNVRVGKSISKDFFATKISSGFLPLA